MLAGKTYCPILHTRVAEMQGLERLPEPTKDLIFPIIVARPWPNALALNRCWERIEAALGSRRYGLTLDPFKRHSGSGRPAASEFDSLFDPADGHSAYYAQVQELPFAVPVLQLVSGEILDLTEQVRHVEAIDRGAILRVEFGNCLNPVELVSRVRAILPEIVVWLDLGWTKDLILREVWASQILATYGADEPEREIVISGSSFPATFEPARRSVAEAQERRLFDVLVRAHNSVAPVYGDWGSTRAPREPSVMRTVKRIDLPAQREWIFFRSDGTEDYRDLARRAVNDPEWPTGINIWGTYLIEGTADGVPSSIRSQAAGAAARINIHLFRQAHFSQLGATGDVDEPYTD